MSLHDALESVAQARSTGDVVMAMRKVRSEVKAERRHVQAKWGALAQAFQAAMQIWDEQKAQGVSRAERMAGLHKTIRSAWPFVREWKYVCDRCLDLGLELFTCPGDATCGRQKRHGAHSYGQPCWCAKGAQFHDKAKPDAGDFTQAGKSKPARGFSRMGR